MQACFVSPDRAAQRVIDSALPAPYNLNCRTLRVWREGTMKSTALPVTRKYTLALGVAMIAALLAATGALAAAGTLDPPFGSGGFTTTNLGLGYGEGRSVALQPDGKIVVPATGDP